MKFVKLILFAIVLVCAVLLGFSVIGFVYSALWYLFWIGVIALGGFVGYKLFKKDEMREIEGRDSVSQIELENAKIIKGLDEYKEKIGQK